MWYRRLSKQLLFAGFVLTYLPLLVPAAAQETETKTTEFVNYLKVENHVRLPTVPEPEPSFDSPPTLQDTGAGEVTNGAGSDDGLFTLQLQHKRLSSSIGVLYSPPSSSYVSRPGNPITDGWQNSIVGELSIDLKQGGSTSIQVGTDVEIYGTDQQLYGPKQASGQNLTLDWGMAKQLSASKRFMSPASVEVGGYQAWTINQPLLAGGFMVVRAPGYTIFTTGVQASFAFPEKNMSFSLRYGTEHLMQSPARHHALAIELSWNW